MACLRRQWGERKLQIVYESPVQSLISGEHVNLAAPRLLYRANREAGTSTDIPLVKLQWNVTVPDGYEAVAADGTLESSSIQRPVPAPLMMAGCCMVWAAECSHRSYLAARHTVTKRVVASINSSTNMAASQE